MSELKSPVQPFIVRHKGALSALQTQSLVQLYQPIIGMDAVNFYLLLMQQPVNERKISSQKVHSSLFPFVAGSLAKIDEARLRLEAIGLLQTYKQASEGVLYPTLLYDMQYPLLINDFLDNPLLSNSLISHLGDIAFFDIVRQWEIAPIDIAEYEEVTVSFDTVFNPSQGNYQSQVEEALRERELANDRQAKIAMEAIETFDYNLMLRKLVQAGVDYRVLGPRMRQEAVALHATYGFDEETVYQLIVKHLDGTKQTIDFVAMKIAAQKASEQVQHVKEAKAESTVQSNDDIKQQYPQLNGVGIELVRLCDRVSPQAMLSQIKKDKKGFVSDQEFHNLKNLEALSTLPKSVQTFLVYYILVIRQRTDFQKGESERVANEWQQMQLDSVPKVLLHIQQQMKTQEMKQKQFQQRVQKRTTPNKREERIPYWMQKKTDQQAGTQNVQANARVKSEDALRQQIDQLFEKGREVNE